MILKILIKQYLNATLCVSIGGNVCAILRIKSGYTSFPRKSTKLS